MVNLEQVEKLRNYTNISYEEAKKILEETNGDVLEAIVRLEKENRLKAPNGGYYSSKEKTYEDINVQAEQNKNYKEAGESIGDLIRRFGKWCGKIINRGNKNSFIVLKNEERFMSIPVTILVMLLVFTFWIAIPLLVIGLFFGYRYRFIGPDLGKESVNRAMDSVADAAEDFIKDIKGDKSNGKDSNN
ncbi:MAG TPA: DUF4342 domain-containing protein [Tissierellaceae bacterium]